MTLPHQTSEEITNAHQLTRRKSAAIAEQQLEDLVPKLQLHHQDEKQLARKKSGFPIAERQRTDVVLPRQPRPRYYVVHLVTELAPVAKVGGLGDVVTAISRALHKKGHRIEIIIPKYRTLDQAGVQDFKKLATTFYSYFEGAMHKNVVWTGKVEGLKVYFIDPQHPAKLFNRDSIYCQPDDVKRFTYFSRAALEFLVQFDKHPDFIHCHDWPVAAVGPLYKSIYTKPDHRLNAKIAFTCHNFEPQGKCSMEDLLASGLQIKSPLLKEHFQDNISPENINLLKCGLLYADFITTVSPTYAKEVLTPEDGQGLHTTLRKVEHKFYGIGNGIDEKVWNPATDPHLKHHFSKEDLKGKELVKNDLRLQLNMAIDSTRPLVCCVTRLCPQKGVHLLRSAIFHVLKRGGQFILQGTSQVPSIEEEFDELAKEFENDPHVRLVLRCEETLTHNIFAAADIFVIPSIYEPCGLTQMYSMRYGTIPVVRKTGGLADSVFDVDETQISVEKRNGFVFTDPTKEALASALDRALDYYKHHPQWWAELVTKVMSINFSWDAAPVEQYIKLYQKYF